MFTIRVTNVAETRAVAARLASLCRAGDIVVLAGDMGAGKTRFAQGFGAALGVADAMTSPTFTLVHSYPVNKHLTLHHADLYRLDQTSDVDDLALHELAEFDGIVLVEWGDVAAAGLGDHLEVRLDPIDEIEHETGSSDDAEDVFGLDEPRWLTFSATGARWVGRWERLTDTLAEFRAER